jgi:hypothetical protein
MPVGRGPQSPPLLPQVAAKRKKILKIVGTNSISPLGSIKVPKNELKTNWFLSVKSADQSEKTGVRNV